MEKRTISFSPPDISEAEIAEVVEALRSGWITTGPRTKELERRMAEYCHSKKQVCLSSATAAEELNLRILGIGPGDEVIVPAYTYTASASAVIHCGATVIFVDSQKDGDPVTHSPEMDYDAMEALSILAESCAIMNAFIRLWRIRSIFSSHRTRYRKQSVELQLFLTVHML